MTQYFAEIFPLGLLVLLGAPPLGFLVAIEKGKDRLTPGPGCGAIN